MTDYGRPTATDKIIPAICIVVLIAFFACLPSMINDKNKRLEQSWQEHGCEMYDEYQINKVPAKCQTYFVDHYQAQAGRTQPPEAK